ncbi:MAG TPA: hypothetical protein VGV38_03625, partial [Pyrinomonadaceae bacterium]|nr:hypothetical protein [Pyrinomonadaceae bacterium]
MNSPTPGRRPRVAAFLLHVFTLAVLSSVAAAQTGGASVSGHVFDEHSAGVGGARVTLQQP